MLFVRTDIWLCMLEIGFHLRLAFLSLRDDTSTQEHQTKCLLKSRENYILPP